MAHRFDTFNWPAFSGGFRRRLGGSEIVDNHADPSRGKLARYRESNYLCL